MYCVQIYYFIYGVKKSKCFNTFIEAQFFAKKQKTSRTEVNIYTPNGEQLTIL